MKQIELAKAYSPDEFEDRIYRMWKEGGYFSPEKAAEGRDPFVVVIPPPNVTGVLHMGHGLNISLQDVLVRYWRMKGCRTLWLPGTDHAGIATQNVVERRLKEQNLSRQDLGRERFIEEAWKVKEAHHRTIVRQLEKIGASCDWSRERFTMDEGLSAAVREAFVSLYERGLLYRGEYLVNWCPSCGTALADDEVEYSERQGGLWEIRYPLTDGTGSLTVATTRPETMFGDTAVAVHPEDERYKRFIGKRVRLPLTERDIPVIADAYVEREFGTGCLKVTPAHDPNDFEIGNRHGLERINIMNEDGTLNGNVPAFVQNVPALKARPAVAEELSAGDFLVSYTDRPHQVGECYRCGAIVEPHLSEQWFVKMKPLAVKALDAWHQKNVVFYPSKWENTYRHWLENIRDWCISRQIWWGHRIPAWTCSECGELHVLRENPDTCPGCGASGLEQDSDVLDTWFSSWLWPFSTMGWPEKTEDLAKYYPTSALVTGYDIIFFWVARMIMAGMEFMEQPPFRDIYITGLIRDKKGRKMSKSLGNGIDPLEIVDQFGSDAMKFTLAYLSAQGEDIPMDMDTCKLGSKFANKVWNAVRFILMNIAETDSAAETDESLQMEPPRPAWIADRWILGRLSQAVERVEKAMNSYRFDEMAHAVYEYFWNDYCDWYVECSKPALYGADSDRKKQTASMLIYVLEESLKLMHPFIPFITEELWSYLPGQREPLIITAYPESNRGHDSETEIAFVRFQDIVGRIRAMRSDLLVPPSARVKVRVEAAGMNFDETGAAFSALVGSDDSALLENNESTEGSIAVSGPGFTSHVYVLDTIDRESAVSRLQKDVVKYQGLVEGKKKKLSNDAFLSRAPAEIIEKERASLADMEDTVRRNESYLIALKQG